MLFLDRVIMLATAGHFLPGVSFRICAGTLLCTAAKVSHSQLHVPCCNQRMSPQDFREGV